MATITVGDAVAGQDGAANFDGELAPASRPKFDPAKVKALLDPLK